MSGGGPKAGRDWRAAVSRRGLTSGKAARWIPQEKKFSLPLSFPSIHVFPLGNLWRWQGPWWWRGGPFLSSSRCLIFTRRPPPFSAHSHPLVGVAPPAADRIFRVVVSDRDGGRGDRRILMYSYSPYHGPWPTRFSPPFPSLPWSSVYPAPDAGGSRSGPPGSRQQTANRQQRPLSTRPELGTR